MDFFGGDDYDFGDSWDMSEIYGSDNTDGWNMNDWWSSGEGSGDMSGWLDSLSDPGYSDSSWYDYGSDSGGGLFSGMGGSSQSGGGSFPWMALLGAGMNAASGWAGSKADQKKLEQQLKMQKDLYAFKLAEDEKYYQAHGKQLADALGNYSQFYNKEKPRPFKGLEGVQSPMNPGLIPDYGVYQLPQQGLLNYGF